MKELLLKSLVCVILAIVVINFFTAISYADNFDIAGYNATADSSIKSPFEGAIGAILSVIRIIGTGVALIILMSIAIKYMSAAPGERAEIKKSSIQYAVGAVILFASTNILTLLVEVFGKVFPG